MKLYLIVLVILLVLPLQSYAYFITGNELLSDISSKPGFETDFGFGYIIGVFDAREGMTFCATSSVTQGQVKRVAKKYMEAHPEKLHRPAVELLLKAFEEAFPCPSR